MLNRWEWWVFLAASIAVYWALPARLRPVFLAVASIGFLGFMEPVAIAAMMALACGCYGCLRLGWSPRALPWVAAGCGAAVLAYLAWHKYVPVFAAALSGGGLAERIAIPLGVSYFSFKTVHYILERRAGTLPDHGLFDFLGFVFLVPIFTSGPIERFDHYLRNRETTASGTMIAEGLHRIAVGLVKRFVGAELVLEGIGLATGPDGLGGMLEHLDTVGARKVWALLVFSYLYVYLDFSGYSDIAIGASRLFGLRIMENFNFPFLAPNMANLWKRWHMTLAGWCQTYVYLPVLAWTRNPYLAVIASFLVIGVWHAAAWNWVAWGLYNAFGVMVYQTWTRLKRKRGWSPPTLPGSPFGVLATNLYFSGSFALTMTYPKHGLYAGFRLLAKCFLIDLPA